MLSDRGDSHQRTARLHYCLKSREQPRQALDLTHPYAAHSLLQGHRQDLACRAHSVRHLHGSHGQPVVHGDSRLAAIDADRPTTQQPNHHHADGARIDVGTVVLPAARGRRGVEPAHQARQVSLAPPNRSLQRGSREVRRSRGTRSSDGTTDLVWLRLVLLVQQMEHNPLQLVVFGLPLNSNTVTSTALPLLAAVIAFGQKAILALEPFINEDGGMS